MMVWKRPEAPVSKIGSTMTTPSALNISKASQSKSSLWMHMFLVPLMSILTQVMQPVQCLMSRSIARMNSTSQPASLAARSTALQMVSLLPFLVPNETPTILVMATPFLSVHKRCAAHLPKAGRPFGEKRKAKAVRQTHREPGQAKTGRCAE